MKTHHTLLLLLLTAAVACSKTEQGVETSFTAVVMDPTTGSLEQPATVHLIEREVLTKPPIEKE